MSLLMYVLLASAALFVASALQPDQPATPDANAPVAPAASPTPASVEAATPQTLAGMADGQLVRVGGDESAKVTVNGERISFDTCAITTPLPAGYPAPTPPGSVDIKKYPTVRRAQVSGDTNADVGMNVGFFPLFNHIKRRDISMTSPVEMEYEGLAATTPPVAKPDGAAPAQPSKWTMSFLYRTADMGEAGADKADTRVEVVDAPGALVLSVGLRGSYGRARVDKGLELLRAWLGKNPEWKVTGEARALYYNGPGIANRNLWSEVQLPIALAKIETPPAKPPQ